jgi:EmrB/QacA subfamily drug resistance transporter
MIGLGRAPCDDGVIRGAAETRGCDQGAKRWVLWATILGSSMAYIDGSVVNVALPAIQADLKASVSGAQWVVNAYTLMLGALILVGGSAGDRFGRRRVFVLGVAIFAAASVACGAAPHPAALTVARAVQGIGGALLVPSSLAIISAAFPGHERGKAIGAWAGFSAIATALGPVLGGWLVDAVSWRAIFLINVPIAGATLGLAIWRVPESSIASDGAAVDWEGGVLATIGLGALAYGLTAASELGWTPPAVLGPLLASALTLAAFIWWEARAPSPMVPLHLFRLATFSGANMITLLLYFGLAGALFFLPFNFIRIQHYSATLAGAAFLPFTLIMGGLSTWSGGLVDRYGARGPLMLGPTVAAAGFAMFAIAGVGGSYWTTFFPAMVVLGVGMAITVAPLTTIVMSAVEDRHAGTASGINNAVARIAGLLAVALLGAVAVGVFGTALENRLAELQVPPDIRIALKREVPKLAEAEAPPQVEGEERHRLEQALTQSFLLSFRVVMLIAAGLALSSAVCAQRTIRDPIARPPGSKLPGR